MQGRQEATSARLSFGKALPHHQPAMTAFETFIEAAANWLRDMVLGILGRHAEEIVTDYVRRKRERKAAKTTGPDPERKPKRDSLA